MLKYDFILRCYFKMMYWHFDADVKAARGIQGIGCVKFKEKKEGKERSGERRKER